MNQATAQQVQQKRIKDLPAGIEWLPTHWAGMFHCGWVPLTAREAVEHMTEGGRVVLVGKSAN